MLKPSNIRNNMFCGDKYREIIEWCFGDTEFLPFTWFEDDIAEEVIKLLPESCQKLHRESPRTQKMWMDESKDRTGIEVVTL